MVTLRETEDQKNEENVFLGGWKNKATGLVYYNAFTQTYGGLRGIRDKRNGTTQTVDPVDVAVDTAQEKAVQVNLEEIFPDLNDKIVETGAFLVDTTAVVAKQSALEQEKMVSSAVKIQRFYRAYRAKVESSKRTARQETVADVCQDSRGKSRHLKRVCELQLPSDTIFEKIDQARPRSKADFDQLYELLRRWHTCEVERAGRLQFPPSKVATCGLILLKEVELLRKIDSMKGAVKCNSRKRRKREFLEELCRPLLWKGNRGKSLLVDTPGTEKAREFRDFYELLDKDEVSAEERRDLLLKLKKIAQVHTCDESDELIYLIHQELDLQSRSLDTSKLRGLRDRLKFAFLSLARNFLPAAAKVPVLSSASSSVRNGVCKSCGRFPGKYSSTRGARSRCPSCVLCKKLRAKRALGNMYEVYERLLRDIRRRERKDGGVRSVAFVVGLQVVYRLVHDIWHGRSPLSGCDDLKRLELVRFRNEVEWSPWNCLLLAREEAAIHRTVSDIDEFYGEDVVRLFYAKNLRAKLYFGEIGNLKLDDRRLVSPRFIGKN